MSTNTTTSNSNTSSTNKISRSKVIAEKWFRGDLTFKLHKGQVIINSTFNSSNNQLFVANIARQWGKSYWAVVKALEQAIKQPKSQIRYGAAFQEDLTSFIIPAFDKVLEDCPKSIAPKYKVQGSEYVFPNGSRIKLVGVDKRPNGLRGNTLDLIILDECGFITNLDYIYKSVIIPATTHRPNAKIILISTPPNTPAHAFRDYCQKAELEGGYSTFSIYDNPLINETTIERLKKESGGDTSTTWRREYLCEFCTDDDSVIIPEWDNTYIQEIERDQYYQYYHKYIGLDLGVKDNTAAIFGYYDFKRASLIIEDELCMNGPSMNTEKLVEALKDKELELWAGQAPFRRVSDNNWPLLIQDLSSIHNYTFISTSKDTLEAMINEVRLLVQEGRILINPKCKMLIGCLAYGVWDNKKKAFARSTAYGHFDHLAALIYLVRNLAQHTNPIPIDHGYSNHKSWLGNIKNQRNSTHNARTIADALIPKKPKLY